MLRSPQELAEAKKAVQKQVKEAVAFAEESPMPPVELAKELEFPDAPDTDYNQREGPAWADDFNKKTISPDKMETIQAHIKALRAKSDAGDLSIGDAINLAIHEEVRTQKWGGHGHWLSQTKSNPPFASLLFRPLSPPPPIRCSATPPLPCTPRTSRPEAPTTSPS